MEVRTAQAEVRNVFLGGSIGQAVSGAIWLVSAALGTWGRPQTAMLVLAVGGAFIFPLTQLALRLLGRPAALQRENPFNALAMQTAFIVPLCLPLIYAATLYNPNWFYPAFMIAVGAHYLPFMTLYGMWQYAILAAALLGGGVAFGMFFSESFPSGGWFTGLVLAGFALLAWRVWAGEAKSQQVNA